MSKKKATWNWLMSLIACVSVVIIASWSIQLINHYHNISEAKSKHWNLVSYPQGNVGTVEPKLVSPGETINVTFKEFCNLGVDVIVDRWVDFLRPDGTVGAAFRLRALEFYVVPGSKGGCVKNLTQPFTVPPDLSGRPPGTDKVRLRNLTSYEEPYQTVAVPSYSETFYLRPDSPEQ